MKDGQWVPAGDYIPRVLRNPVEFHVGGTGIQGRRQCGAYRVDCASRGRTGSSSVVLRRESLVADRYWCVPDLHLGSQGRNTFPKVVACSVGVPIPAVAPSSCLEDPPASLCPVLRRGFHPVPTGAFATPPPLNPSTEFDLLQLRFASLFSGSEPLELLDYGVRAFRCSRVTLLRLRRSLRGLLPRLRECRGERDSLPPYWNQRHCCRGRGTESSRPRCPRDPLSDG